VIEINDKLTKISITQAKILGRVERLTGNCLESNPFPKETEQWAAFIEGWTRSIDNPILSVVYPGKESRTNSSK
jgi:hypothetical protein